MDDYYRNNESEEPEAVDSGTLLVQLREKLKTQAQRIRSLETYKVLCEERLSELYPSHPLPVLPEHIGSGGPSLSQELLNSRQKIAKLEQQLSQSAEIIPSPSNSVTYNKLHELYTLLHQKYNAIFKEKNELEESLRNEMQASEEQRAYIEVLKQAIEIKIESFGFKGLSTEEFAEFSQAKISTDESRRETSRLTTKLLDYESQAKSLAESLKIKSNECKDLVHERDELTDQLHQAAEALQYAEEEVQKLEEEKSNLIDYVETQSKIELDLKNEIKELKNRLGSLQDENKKNFRNSQSYLEENKKLANELENLKNEFNRNEKTLKETQQSFINLKARIEEKDKTIQKYKEENNSISIQNSSLQAENIGLCENIAKVEAELRLNKSDLETSRVEEVKIKDNLSYLKHHSQQVQEEKLKLEKSFLETDHKLQELESAHKSTAEKCVSLTKSLEESTAEVARLKSLLQKSQDSEETLQHLNTDLKNQHMSLQNELDSLLKRHQSTNNELFSLREELEQSKLKLVSLSQENTSLEVKFRELYSAFDLEKQNSRFFQEENLALKNQIDDLNKNLELANESFHEKNNLHLNAENEIENLSKVVAQLQTDLSQEKYAKTSQHEELVKTSSDAEKFKKEAAFYREAYETASRSAKRSTSYLSPSNSSKFKEFCVSFAENSPAEGGLHKWIEEAIVEIQELAAKTKENTQQIGSLQHKNSLLSKDLESANQEQGSLKAKELLLKSQIENSNSENAFLREKLKAQVNSLQQEIINLRNTIQVSHEEIEQSNNKNRALMNELSLLRNRMISQEQTLQQAELKLKVLSSEKNHLENLLSNYKNFEKTGLRISA